jgi:hypothetical protein
MKIAVTLVGLLLVSGSAQAQNYNFALLCTYRGGAASFVVNGDYTKDKASISRVSGGLAEGQLAFDMGASPNPTIALRVRGTSQRQPGSTWSDLYVIDLNGGRFTHVNEQSFNDGSTFMAVQSGTCVSTAKQ